MKCPVCLAGQARTAPFCLHCGAPLHTHPDIDHVSLSAGGPSSLCPACRHENAPISRFCTACGVPLTDALHPSDLIAAPLDLPDERRTVTVLHADVSGFTRIAGRLNPEQTRALIDALFSAVSREILALGGVVDAYIGDAVLASFGVPAVHDDDPRRAADAALALHRTVERFTHPVLTLLGTRLQMRVGIDTGPVIVGRIGALRRTTVTGATVVAAMELERAAPVGGTLTGETTRRLLPDRFLLTSRLLPSGRLAYQLHGRAPGIDPERGWNEGSREVPSAGEGGRARTRIDRRSPDEKIECYFCGWSGPEEARRCGGCGRDLDVSRCDGCHHLLAADSRHCGRCGAPRSEDRSAARGAPEEQLRQVTVLFALLNGLHDVVEEHDPEELRDLLDGCFRVLSAEIRARGGTIDKYMADSLLAVFGVPSAHEDDPARAVSAALGMLDALEAFNRRLFESRGLQLELKIGINTGKVLVGSVGGDETITVMGDVVNTASRVEHAAPLGGILICDSTRRSLGSQFTLRPQPPLIVKGKDQPLVVYRVVRAEADVPAGPDLSHLPLIGREREFDQLALCWRELIRPETRVGGRRTPIPGVERLVTRTGEHPSLARTGEHPSLAQTGEHPSLARKGEHPSLARAGEHPSLTRTGEHPSLTRTGEHPSLARAGEHPSLARTGEHPSLARTGEQRAEGGEERAGADFENETPSAGRWVTILGDVGLGTDRLLREFQGYAALDPCTPRIHTTRGVSFVTAGGAGVLRRLLESLAGIQPGDTLELEAERLFALARRIAGTDPETGETVRADLVVRSLVRLAGMRMPDGLSEGRPATGTQRMRQQDIAYLSSLCASLAREQPLLIIASELQWAEEAALDFLEALGSAPPGHLMLVTAARPALLDRRPLWGRCNTSHILVTLSPLSLRDTHALVRAVAGDQPVPHRLIEALHGFTGGNPFYLTETLRYHLESRGALAAPGGLEALTVPDSLEGVLQSRLDRLAFEEGLTLRAAAVIGPVFWRSAVAAVLGGDRGEALERLRAHGFIQRRIPASIPDEEEYSFEHVLTAKVAAGNLLETVRRRYHLAAASWLVDRCCEAVPLELGIAQHFEAGGAPERAAPYFARAADRALAGFDCAEAIALFERALAGFGAGESEVDPVWWGGAETGAVDPVWWGGAETGAVGQVERSGADGCDRVAGTAEVDGGAGGDLSGGDAGTAEVDGGAGTVQDRHGREGVVGPGPELLARVLARRGEARRMSGELEPALQDFLAAAAVSGRMDDVPGAASSWYRAGLVHLALGRLEPAKHAADAGDRLLGGRGAPGIAAVGQQLRAELLMADGALHEARPSIEQALALWRRSGDRWGLAHGLHAYGRLLMTGSDFSAAQRAFREALGLRESLGDRIGLANTLHNLGAVNDCLGHLPEALGYYHRSLKVNRRLENRTGLAGTLMNQGVIYMRCGYFGRTRAGLEESLELHRILDMPWGIGACQGNLGHLWIQLGRLREAGSYLSEAVRCFEGLGDEEALAEFLTDLATCRLREGLVDEARTLGDRAFRVLRRRAGGGAEAQVLQLLGAVALARGDVDQARELIEEIEWNEAAQATPELRMKTALLAGRVALAGHRASSAAARFEEAERVAMDHDLAPGTWEARALRHRALREAGDLARAAVVEQTAAEAFRELLARVEDPELVELLQGRTSLLSSSPRG